jgi:hypothetical protein
MAIFTNGQFTGLAIVAGIGALILYKKSQDVQNTVVDVINDMSESINPVSTNNVVYTGVNKLGQSITGDQNMTLGTAVYDIVDGVRGLWGDSDEDRLLNAESLYVTERKNGVYETVGGGG